MGNRTWRHHSKEGWEGFSAEDQVTPDLSCKEQEGGLQVGRCRGVQKGREAAHERGSVMQRQICEPCLWNLRKEVIGTTELFGTQGKT